MCSGVPFLCSSIISDAHHYLGTNSDSNIELNNSVRGLGSTDAPSFKASLDI